ncbi:MAG: nitroreductase/quinone reductase family protein [Chloroflexota bacterium]
MSERYLRPGWFTHHLLNPLVEWLTRRGVSVYGSRILAVRGRRSGQWRMVPVNLLEYRGQRYLVAPRGVTEWVRNIRAAGEAELRLGSGRQPVKVVELADIQKAVVLRAYLRRWRWEVGQFFEGIGPGATQQDLERAAPKHPIFRIL